MIRGLGGATIWSEDLTNLLPFYRDVLGLTVRIETPRFVVFGTEDSPALALGTHSEVHGRNADPARHMVGLSTDDVTAEWKRWRIPDRDLDGSRGQPDPARGADGSLFMRGNPFELFEPPRH